MSHGVSNSRRALGAERPAGARRLRWNLLMVLSIALATLGSLFSIWSKTRWTGILSLIALVAVAAIWHFARTTRSKG